MHADPYKRLAERLDALPNGFPPAADGAELRLLVRLFTPEEANLAAQLRLTKETPEAIAARLGVEKAGIRPLLKGMARRGLIGAGRAEGGLGYGLIPFVVGIYENQNTSLDEELARLFEAYFKQSFGEVLSLTPQLHRVVPIREDIHADMEIHPYESASGLVDAAVAWGVLDCICRKQKALIGEACGHPLDVCMVLSDTPHAFDGDETIRALTCGQAHATLRRAAEAGLVHTVSNSQGGLSYICNCCTCSCGILRGLAEMGIANVVARSAFVNRVEAALCDGCETCLSYCQFTALQMGPDGTVLVDEVRCTGCGVCVPACPNAALSLLRRPADQVKPPPATLRDWQQERAAARGRPLEDVI